MAEFGPSRTRFLTRYGRPMTLRRAIGSTSSSYIQTGFQGFYALYKPEQIQGGIQQGDAQLQLGSDIVSTALAAPRINDQTIIDNRTWKVLGVYPVADGSAVIGYTCWIRGG